MGRPRTTDAAIGTWRVAFTRPLTLTYILQAALGMSGGVIITVWSLYMVDRGASLPLIGLSYSTYALPRCCSPRSPDASATVSGASGR